MIKTIIMTIDIEIDTFLSVDFLFLLFAIVFIVSVTHGLEYNRANDRIARQAKKTA